MFDTIQEVCYGSLFISLQLFFTGRMKKKDIMEKFSQKLSYLENSMRQLDISDTVSYTHLPRSQEQRGQVPITGGKR